MYNTALDKLDEQTLLSEYEKLWSLAPNALASKMIKEELHYRIIMNVTNTDTRTELTVRLLKSISNNQSRVMQLRLLIVLRLVVVNDALDAKFCTQLHEAFAKVENYPAFTRIIVQFKFKYMPDDALFALIHKSMFEFDSSAENAIEVLRSVETYNAKLF